MPGERRRACPTLIVAADAACGAAPGAGCALISDDLPAPETPVTATITPSGNATSMFLRLCSRAPLHLDAARGLAALASGSRCARCPRGTRPVSDAGSRAHLVGRALGDDAGRRGGPRPDRSRRPSRPPRSSPRRARRRCTRVAEVAQPAAASRSAARCRAGAGRSTARRARTCTPDSSRAELRREPDALRLAARQRRRRAIERQVVEPDVEQERRAASLISFRTSLRDLRARAREPQRRRSSCVRLAHRHRRDVDDRLARRGTPRATRAAGAGPLQARHGLSRK